MTDISVKLYQKRAVVITRWPIDISRDDEDATSREWQHATLHHSTL